MFSAINLFFPKMAIKGTTPVPDQQTAVTTVAITPAGYIPATAGGGGVNLVTFEIQLAAVRCRWDGGAPTSTVGHLLALNSSYTWPVSQYNAASFICDGAGTNATVYASAMNV